MIVQNSYREVEKRETVSFLSKKIDFSKCWFVTLRPTMSQSDLVTQSNRLRDFQFRLNRKLFNHGFEGLHKATNQQGCYLKMIPVMEKNTTDDGIHWHILIEDPANQSIRPSAKNLKETMRRIIHRPYSGFCHPERFDKSDTEWFKPVDEKTECDTLNYIAKALERGLRPVCWENLYI